MQKWINISEEAKLLANNKIETSSDLESYYMKKNEELKLALGEREVLWDRRTSKKNHKLLYGLYDCA